MHIYGNTFLDIHINNCERSFYDYSHLKSIFHPYSRVTKILHNIKKIELGWHRNSAFYQILNLFSVFFALYHFVSHTKFSVSLYSETSKTNLLFRYFASLIFASVSFRFEAKCRDTLAALQYCTVIH